MRRTGLIRLEYRPEELQYLISSDDVEEMLADYASSHSISETYRKELERFVWQFLRFVKTGRLESGNRIKAPTNREEYVVSRRVLVEYVRALIRAGYANSSMTKRLQAVILLLRMMGVSEVLIDALKDPLRKVNTARKIEQEENTPDLTLEDAREFFKRLELLFQLGRLKEKQYAKALAFALLLFSTGRRVSEVVQLRIDDIDFETHAIKLPAARTKEGKLLGIEGHKIVFMTREAEYAVKYYLELSGDEIRRRDGYLFMRPGKRSLKDTFLHKIAKKSRNLEDLGANLNFITSDGLHRFEIKYFRKLLIQEWERRAEEKGMNNEKVFGAVRKLTGHRPSNDVHRTNYARISVQELWKYYRELYYDISVLTEGQKRMIGILPRKTASKPTIPEGSFNSPSKTNATIQHGMALMAPVHSAEYTGLLN
ncbi:tyrosine-type recombinase/integrase [Thermococcus sp. MAR1]|uniref:tyrosine-type recombinase/integrase n=1 Tax=Thermococcus sp. MAR1 TaxID=1638263 RepID=UPI00143BCB1F|nr:tyrosine-type recombinase/integrase [Thermococcus sp. MAR1]NJE10944.1 hypothetical protein [Thermococcus sp. MAR1]